MKINLKLRNKIIITVIDITVAFVPNSYKRPHIISLIYKQVVILLTV